MLLQTATNRKQLCKTVSTILVGALIASCSKYGPAPVIHLSSPLEYKAPPNLHSDDDAPEFHYVVKGDTLFSIAWRYGVDYRELAEINGIADSFRIYPGQKLFFAPIQDQPSDGSFDSNALRSSVLVALGIETSVPTLVEQKEESTSSQKVVSNRSQQTPQPVVQTPPTRLVEKKNTRQTSSHSGNGLPSASKVSRWLWPVRGQILDGFSGSVLGNKGLDISGKPGQAVRAAAPGRVVYRGNSLKGYGNLIIVKHNDDYLSAYAHNSKIHVQENEIVKAGQIIADIGNSGAEQNKLHFEIRYRGKPVDPIKYLPKL